MILKVAAVFFRVLKQVLKDFRLVSMMYIGPIITIWLLFVVFEDKNDRIRLGIVLNNQQNIRDFQFLNGDFILEPYQNTSEVKKVLEKDQLLAAVDFTGDSPKVTVILEGTRPLQSQKIVYRLFKNFLANAKDQFQDQLNRKIRRIERKLPIQDLKSMKQSLIDEDQEKIAFFAQKLKEMDVNIRFPKIDVNEIPTDPNLFFKMEYLYGGPELSYFDSIAPTLISFLVFFLVFLIGGIAFLRERTTHTLSRTFATPIREWHFILGYFLAFVVVILLQVIGLQAFSLFVLHIVNNGSWFYLFLINLFVSFTGLVLGFIFSTVSKTEFQLVQFIPIIVIPQFIFSGIFDTSALPASINFIGDILPLHYASTALVDVAIRGRGFAYVLPSLIELGIFLVLLLICNAFFLRKIRQEEG